MTRRRTRLLPLVLGAVLLGTPSRSPADDGDRPLLLRIADAKDPGRERALAAWQALGDGDRTTAIRAALSSEDPALAFVAATVASPWILDLSEIHRLEEALAPGPLARFGPPETLRPIADGNLTFGSQDLQRLWRTLAASDPDPPRRGFSRFHRCLLSRDVPALVPLLSTAAPRAFRGLLWDLVNQAQGTAGDANHASYVEAFRYGLARLRAEKRGLAVPGRDDVPRLGEKPGLPAAFVEIARATWGPPGDGFDLGGLPDVTDDEEEREAPRPPHAEGPESWLVRWAQRLAATEEDLPFLLETLESPRARLQARVWAARRLAALGGRSAGKALHEVLAAGGEAATYAAAELAARGAPEAWEDVADLESAAAWLADPEGALIRAGEALRRGETPEDLEEGERWFNAWDLGIEVPDAAIRSLVDRVRAGGVPPDAAAWFFACVAPEEMSAEDAETLARRWGQTPEAPSSIDTDLRQVLAAVEVRAPQALVALLRRWATEAPEEQARLDALLLLARLGDPALADRMVASWDSWPNDQPLLGRVASEVVSGFLREQAASEDPEVESPAVQALAVAAGCPEPLAEYLSPLSRGDDDPGAWRWAEAKALVLAGDPIGAVLLRTAEGPNVGVAPLEWTAGFGMTPDPRVRERVVAWRSHRPGGLYWYATAILALLGDAEAEREWGTFLGEARTFLLDDLQEPRLFTRGGDPAWVAAWVERLDENCCLAWHADTVLRATFPTMPHVHYPGDGGRARAGAERWFARHRGAFAWSRLLDAWVPAAPGR